MTLVEKTTVRFLPGASGISGGCFLRGVGVVSASRFGSVVKTDTLASGGGRCKSSGLRFNSASRVSEKLNAGKARRSHFITRQEIGR